MEVGGLFWGSLQPRGSLDWIAHPGFDGNQTDHITNWLIPREGAFTELDEDVLTVLGQMTNLGNISWVLFPSMLLTEEDQIMLML